MDQVVQPAVTHVHTNVGGARKGNVGPASVASKTSLPTDDPCGIPNATEKVLISKTIIKRLFRGRSKYFIDELKKFRSCNYLSKHNSSHQRKQR